MRFVDMPYGSHFETDTPGEIWVKLQDLTAAGYKMEFVGKYSGTSYSGQDSKCTLNPDNTFNAVRIKNGYVGRVPLWLDCKIIKLRTCCEMETNQRKKLYDTQ
jgi:hypothetical protein